MRLSELDEPAATGLITGLGLAVALAVVLVTGVTTPADLVTPGGLGPSAEVLRLDFGDDAVDPTLTGYDGQQVYAIARFFPDLASAEAHLDRPRYRMMRILPPALASVAPSGAATVVALALINVTGIALAAAATASLLRAAGTPTWLAIPACAPLLLGLATSTVGPIAWGLTLTALVMALRGRHGRAVLILTLGALCRETVAVAALLIGLGLAASDPKQAHRALAPYVLPGAVVGAWFLVLALVVPGDMPSRVDPFGVSDVSGATLLGVITVFVLGVIAIVSWRDRTAIVALALGFTAWMAFYTEAILDPIALVRVNAVPIILGLAGLARLSVGEQARSRRVSSSAS